MELNETTLEQILSRQREDLSRELQESFNKGLHETRHHMGILVEGLRSDIQAVAEGVISLNEQLAVLREMIAKNTEDIELMKTDIEIIKAELAIIRRDLKEKVGRDEIAVLEARVAMLERSSRGRT